MMKLELTPEEFELVQSGLGSMMQDRRFSANRQWDAQKLSQKLWHMTEGDK
jgi:hypothetical protein